MAEARIYQKPKSAMQSGRGGTDRWVLEFVSRQAKRADPLTGWAGGGETEEQVLLEFSDLAAAQAYADKYEIVARVIPSPVRAMKLQAYADNFR